VSLFERFLSLPPGCGFVQAVWHCLKGQPGCRALREGTFWLVTGVHLWLHMADF
jgi:hypothetical protein